MAERERAAQDHSPVQAAAATQRPLPFDAEPLDAESPDAEVEARSFEDEAEPSELAAQIDPRAIGEPDNAQLDWGEPLGDDGLVHGANHTRRAVYSEADRAHGPKTRRRTKDIINGKR